jgi:hypothetical protein
MNAALVGANELVEGALVSCDEALDQLGFEFVRKRHVRPWCTTLRLPSKVVIHRPCRG